MSRSQLYSSFKRESGTNVFNNVRWPRGNADFWRNALGLTRTVNIRNRWYQETENEFTNLYRNPQLTINIQITERGNMTERIERVKLLKELMNRFREDNDFYLVIKYDDNYRIVNEKVINEFTVRLENENYEPDDGLAQASDVEIVNFIMENNNIEFSLLYKQRIPPQRNIFIDDDPEPEEVEEKHWSNEQRNGSFFPFLVKDKYYNPEWERYGLFSKVNEKYHNQNCFFHALKEHNILSEIELTSISMELRTTNIPFKCIKEIAKQHDLQINLYDVKNSKTTPINKHPEHKQFNIALFHGHYFIRDKETKTTSYYLKHIDELQNEKNATLIVGKIVNKNNKKNKIYYDRQPSRVMSSPVLFQLLIKNKEEFLTPIDKDTSGINLTPYFNDVKDSNNLEYPPSDARLVSIKKPRNNKKEKVIIYFDTETYLKNLPISRQCKECKDNNDFNIKCVKCIKKNREQTPYMIHGYDPKNNKEFKFCGYDCINNFKNELLKHYNNENHELYLFAHNLGFDFRIFLSHKYGVVTNMIERGHSVISGTMIICGNNNKLTLNFKDSMAFVVTKLSKFPEMFGLNDEKSESYIKIQKEAICHDWYSNNRVHKYFNTNEFFMNRDECLKVAIKSNQFSSKEEYEAFVNDFDNTIKAWNLDPNKIDMMEYANRYCWMDVLILTKGFSKFREWMLEITSIDVCTEVCTMASLADKYLKLEGCYEGCYELANKPRAFIQRSVVGGRCMTLDNKKYHVKTIDPSDNERIENVQYIKSKIQDYDAVSLYPSAMYRMKGFLKGTPKVISQESLKKSFTKLYQELKSYSGFFVEVEILKVGKNRGFPLLSKLTEQGIRNFSNDLVGEKMVIDNITMKDCIKYQNMEFKIIRGYYFNDGFNNKICESIKYLFDERVNKKKEKRPDGTIWSNPIQEMYKLLMNASYGKNIEKEHDSKKLFFNKEADCYKQILRNHNIVQSWSKLPNGRYVLKLKDVVKSHYARPHIGAQVLSMSKRIMNEVMCLAEDIGAKIYYQDTDSMHIEEDKIEELERKFTEMREKKKGSNKNKFLKGSEMGQFHRDFDDKTLKKSYANKYNTELPKDVIPKSNEAIFLGKKSYIDVLEYGQGDKKVYDYHIRMKGVPNKAITNYKDENNNIVSPLQLYKNAFKGEKLTFDLYRSGCIMDFLPNFTIADNAEFDRTVSFKID